jgi:nucleoside phosphorylase
MAFEMELGAVAQIAFLMNVPLIAVKCISDIIGESNLTDYNTFSLQACAKLVVLVEKVLNIL